MIVLDNIILLYNNNSFLMIMKLQPCSLIQLYYCCLSWFTVVDINAFVYTLFVDIQIIYITVDVTENVCPITADIAVQVDSQNTKFLDLKLF